jgi:hypothetical protein
MTSATGALVDFRALIPLSDTIPAHWMWFQVFLIVTFAIHLVFMNAMLGSSIIALAGLLRRGAGRLADARTGRAVVPSLIAFTINSGVAPLLFVHVLYGHFLFTSSVLMAWWWLSVVGLLLLAYAGAYIVDFRFDALNRLRTALLTGIAGLLMAVAFIFSCNMTLMLSPQHWLRYLAHPTGTLLSLADPMLLPRYLHFLTASVAVGGLAMAWMWRRREKSGEHDARHGRHRAMGWYNVATALQFLVGSAFLISLPPTVRSLFLGGAPLATALLALSLMGGLTGLVLGLRRRLIGCTLATLVTIFLMVLVRDQLRRAMLAPFFSPENLTVDPQSGPLVLFIAALVLVSLAVWILLRLAVKSGREARP